MNRVTVFIKKKLLFILAVCVLAIGALLVRVVYIQIFKAEALQEMAYEQQTRDRLISPKRGDILDRNGVSIGTTQSVYAVSVIHNQVENEEETAKYLSNILDLDYEDVLKKVSQKVALVRIQTKVNDEIAQAIWNENIQGVVVDEDIKRIYPYSNMASHVVGFVGKDNQGIIGLEAKYDEYLKGKSGKILTLTDSKGVEISDYKERIEPINGGNLVTSLDVVIQQYAEQTIEKAVIAKKAKSGGIIVLNPQNGEIYAMANYPNFDLNKPFEINNYELEQVWDAISAEEQNKYLNGMWRNVSINDTYEPGSTFKIVTSAAGLEEGAVTLNSTFVCTGSHTVGGRTIKCWRSPRTHGVQSFQEGVQNSCNPVFMVIAQNIGAQVFREYLSKFGFDVKTGVDLPGEVVGIMHKAENMGPVELATTSFGQSIQITPLQLLRAASAVVNGGYLITPHLAKEVIDENGNTVKTFEYDEKKQIISKETSDIMKGILESVVAEGTGNKAYISGYRIGGKTATSEKLPRKNNKYIASFMTFAPADNSQVMALVIIDEPQGVYYGGTVAGPVMKELLANTLPYLGIEPVYSEEEVRELPMIQVPDFIGRELNEARRLGLKEGFLVEVSEEVGEIVGQFPPAGEIVNKGSKILLYGK